MTTPTKWPVRPAKTQISLGYRLVWSESSLCSQCVAKDPNTWFGQWRLWSDWADVQADPSLRWAHMPFCWFFIRWLQCLLTEVVCFRNLCVLGIEGFDTLGTLYKEPDVETTLFQCVCTQHWNNVVSTSSRYINVESMLSLSWGGSFVNLTTM